MTKFEEILTNEYVNEYISMAKKMYSEPKIYDAKGDLSKRWYVYFYFRDPEDGKMKKQKPIFKGANRFKTRAERTEILNTYRKALINLLKDGFSPYENNQQTKERLEKLRGVNDTTEKIVQTPVTNLSTGYTVKKALAFALKQREPDWAKKTAGSMKGHYDRFIEWLTENDLLDQDISELKRNHIMSFLNQLKTKPNNKSQKPKPLAPKTKNNYRATLSSLFAILESDEIIPSNFIGKVKPKKSTPKKNKPFSNKQVKEIREHLDTHDPYLRIFIQFMSYAFLRNKEVCNIRIKDIDLDSKRIFIGTKVESQTAIPIIKELEDIIRAMNIEKYDRDDFLITRFGHPAPWNTDADNKSGYFSKRFNTNVREPLKLDMEHTLYSFRHSAAINIFKSLRDTKMPHDQILFRLMSITRHKSIAGLKNYLREIGATLPEDYGNIYTIEF
ncbi:site-specific integrase [Kordia sp. YSTF-M3]|uniref:Site-specific integrase n=1 Tax=Kordia aestuariivivens TaxID=2759037 RepID=A0ABR7Q5Y5_9FLAO|nr:tyrosine-type recombinase/integrase [Kordia aestuariivivens]MBC8753991.1 site-specific integrase [Kordia aestuariivivens]